MNKGKPLEVLFGRTRVNRWRNRYHAVKQSAVRNIPYLEYVIWRAKRPRIDTTVRPIRLHIGCGRLDVPGFINIDMKPGRHVHVVKDMRCKRLWLPRSVDLIYASHVLEHVPFKEVPAVLKNLRSILKEDGVLRLSVPDFDALVQIYELSGADIAHIEQPLMGGQRDRHDYHMSVFNEKSLTTLLRGAGFSEVRKWDPRKCPDHNIEDYSTSYVDLDTTIVQISLNIEAVK